MGLLCLIFYFIFKIQLIPLFILKFGIFQHDCNSGQILFQLCCSPFLIKSLVMVHSVKLITFSSISQILCLFLSEYIRFILYMQLQNGLIQQFKMIRSLTKNSPILVNAFRSSTNKNGGYSISSKPKNQTQKQGNFTQEAERVFQQFFQQNPPKESEKSFFDMNYNHQRETAKLDPFKTLQIQKDASKQKIDQAYRKLAMKYHPKKDPSFQATQKFINIAQAYQMLCSKHKKIEKNSEKSLEFMDIFDNSVQSILGNDLEVRMTQGQKNRKEGYKTAEIYSESKNVKKFGNQKQVVLEKEYNNNGKLIKITVIEKHKQDGSIQVKETYDDGTELKENNFVKGLEVNSGWDKDSIFGHVQTYQFADKTEKGKKDQKEQKGQGKQKKQQKKEDKQKKDDKQKKEKKTKA